MLRVADWFLMDVVFSSCISCVLLSYPICDCVFVLWGRGMGYHWWNTPCKAIFKPYYIVVLRLFRNQSKSQTNFITVLNRVHHAATIVMVICTDGICRCKSKYHTITVLSIPTFCIILSNCYRHVHVPADKASKLTYIPRTFQRNKL